MDPILNPYTPGAGTQPPVLSGREDQLRAFEILLKRLKLGKPEKSMIITGLRGVGKTVLLNTFEDIAEKTGFRTAKTEITHETDFKSLMARMARRTLLSLSARDRLKEAAVRAAGILKSFTLKLPEGLELGFDIDALTGQADSGNLSEDLSDLFLALGFAAKDHNTGIAFLIDEIQFFKKQELEAIIAALHRAAQKSLPVTLVGAGLPQLPSLAGTAKSYAERLFDFPMIGELNHEAAENALKIPAQKENIIFKKSATEEIIKYTEGYPYFLQEYGRHVWNLAENNEITIKDVKKAKQLVQSQLDDNFFRVRVARVTSSELRYMSAMSSLGKGPYKSGEIATVLNKPGPEHTAPVRAQLIEKGMIYSPSFGLNEFTVPQFDLFMNRTYPFNRIEEWTNNGSGSGTY